jgi:hypothetical protein
MDPLVSLYYYAPVCAVMNVFVALVVEMPKFQMADLVQLGPWVLIANASCAFLLNVASVFLVCSHVSQSLRSKVLTFTDWQNIISCADSLWCYQERRNRRSVRDPMGNHRVRSPVARIFNRQCRTSVLQSWLGRHQECLLARADDVGITRNELQREESHPYSCWGRPDHIPSICFVERRPTCTRSIVAAGRHRGSYWSIQAA